MRSVAQRFVVTMVLSALLVFAPAHASVAQEAEPLPDDFKNFLTAAGLEVPDTVQYSKASSAATLVPLVYAQNLRITANGNEVTGTFDITNQGSTIVGDIGYEILILGPAPQATAGQLVADTAPVYDRVLQPEKVTLSPQGTTSVAFTYQAPAVPAGDYRLRVQLLTSNDRALGWDTANLSLSGASTYAILQADTVGTAAIDGLTSQERMSWGALEGVNVAPGQALTVNANAGLVGTTPLHITPTLTVRRLLQTGSVPTTTTGTALTLAPETPQTISVPLSAATQPGAYQVVLSLHDEQQQRLSTLAEFRYVVTGVSASVVTASFADLQRESGQQAVVAFTVVGPADRQTNVPGSVEVSVLNGTTVAGSTSETVQLNADARQGTARVTLNQRLDKPGLRVVIKDQAGTILDTYESMVADDTPATTARQNFPQAWWWMVLLGGLLLVIIAIGLVWRSRRNTSNPPSGSGTIVGGTLALLLLLGSGIMGQLPQTEASGIQFRHYWWHKGWGSPATNLFVNKPQHQSSVSAGIVPYEARLEWLACTNSYNVGNIVVQTPTSPQQTSFDSVAKDQTGWNIVAQYSEQRNQYDPTGVVGFTFLTNLDFSNLAPGAVTSVRTWSETQSAYATGWSRAIISDFSWLTIAAPSPSPAATNTPAPSCVPTAATNEAVTKVEIDQSGSWLDGDGSFLIDTTTGKIKIGAQTGRGTPSTYLNFIVHVASGKTYQKLVSLHASGLTDQLPGSWGAGSNASIQAAQDVARFPTPHCSNVVVPRNTSVRTIQQGSSVGLSWSDGLKSQCGPIRPEGFAITLSGGSTASAAVICPSPTATPGASVVALPQACTDGGSVVAFTQGKNRDGSAVRTERSNPAAALGPVDQSGNYYVSLGYGGSLTLRLDATVANGAGSDLVIYETSGVIFQERARVEASFDGTTWVTLGTATNGASGSTTSNSAIASSFDLGSLKHARFVRLTDTTDPSLTQSNAYLDGFDWNAVEGLNCGEPEATPTPSAVTQCSDAKDNDADAKIDSADPGCHTDADPTNAATYTPTDNDESDRQCSDAKDNDGDGKIDRDDPACHTDRNPANPATYRPLLDSEVDPVCSDSKDNDGDGKIDRDDPGCRTTPADPATYNPNDTNETDPGLNPGPIQEIE